jgi:FkbM family methyltransferase
MKIFDIGANLGNFCQACINTIPEVEVIIVEANNSLVDSLKSRFARNNVTILHNAISNENNVDINFYISNAHTISTCSKKWIEDSRFTNEYNWDKVITVKTITIDHLIELYGIPDILKIDVEGYEYNALQGLTKKVNKICFEWAEESLEEIKLSCEYLKNLGYDQFGYIFADEYLKEPDTYTDYNNFNLFNDLNPSRREKWGMIWVK